MAKARPIIGLDPLAPTGDNARLIARERLADMDAYAAYAEHPEHIQKLHDLRIATKRVRYTLEIFADVLPATSQEFVTELTQLQDELGALHDSEVMLALLHQLLHQDQAAPEYKLLSPDLAKHVLLCARRSSPSVQEIEGLMDFLRRQEQRREMAYNAFRRHWEALEQRHFRAALAQMLS
ncbi:MAG TPA: CHAD domain-containing protein [Ktedonobacteraceae bacterium]